jgi:hypothetical protein
MGLVFCTLDGRNHDKARYRDVIGIGDSWLFVDRGLFLCPL